MNSQIITKAISRQELRTMAQELFGDMVKAVVDIKKGIMAVHAELHVDLEEMLLSQGSAQSDVWGINLYPANPRETFIEYDSMVNIRPSQGNRSRNVESVEVRERIKEIVQSLIHV